MSDNEFKFGSLVRGLHSGKNAVVVALNDNGGMRVVLEDGIAQAWWPDNAILLTPELLAREARIKIEPKDTFGEGTALVRIGSILTAIKCGYGGWVIIDRGGAKPATWESVVKHLNWTNQTDPYTLTTENWSSKIRESKLWG